VHFCREARTAVISQFYHKLEAKDQRYVSVRRVWLRRRSAHLTFASSLSDGSFGSS
jgi:hypothetical protein